MNIGIGNLILNLIYPPRCIFCGTRLSPKVRIAVCDKCSNNLPYCKAYKRCKSCGIPIAQGTGDKCKRCYISRRNITRSTSTFVYVDNARSAIIKFKRSANSSYGRVLSFYIAGMVKSDFKGVEFDAVVSVPPRKKPITKDKFDQAAFLAKEVSLRLGIPYISNALYQVRHIKKQSSLSFNARLENVKNAFSVKKQSAVGGKTILLIDDVRTSGATLEECAKSLKDSGAYKIYSATAAIAIIGN